VSERILHIITHDVPWPADFGGVMDLFYKIKALHQAGAHIHLHCFVNKRPPQHELGQYCTAVYYYPRKKYSGFSFTKPFIVNTRNSTALLQRLQQDNYPILIEGIHCSYWLHAGKLKKRTILLRLHNAEYEYYQRLAVHEKNIFKKMYFSLESRLLKKYEQQLAGLAPIAAVSSLDVQLYKQAFAAGRIFHLPVFIPYTEALGLEGCGCYCLYHGNLSVNENEEAAIWLLQEVFSKIPVPFVIAGKNPSTKLEACVHQYERSCLVANPTDKELHDLIAKAQVNVLPSFNNTGVKLKLLNALYNGRHCIVNKAGVAGSGLESICTIIDNDADSFKTAIQYLYTTPYTVGMNEVRNSVLQQLYCNQKNTEKLVEIFWS
jgi:hypothetical protein